MCNGRRVLLPLDLMPEGHTFSIGVSSLQAPSATKRRVGAHLLHVCDDVTTPLSSLGIHDDLVTYGGFTQATSRLALVDGQPPANFIRPTATWATPAPPHTPALEFVVSDVLDPSASSGISVGGSPSTPLAPGVLMTVDVPNFGAIQIPPVVTLTHSPPAATTTSASIYPNPSVISGDSPEPVAHTRVSSSPDASPNRTPILQWPSPHATDPTASMPQLDRQNVGFGDLLVSSSDWASTPRAEWDPVVVARLNRRRRDRAMASGADYQSLPPLPYAAVTPHQALSPARVVAPRSPVRAPVTPAYGGPLMSSVRALDAPSPSHTIATPIENITSSSEDEA